MSREPIAFLKWYPDIPDERVTKQIPPHDGDVFFRSGHSAVHLSSEIRTWITDNDNAQYLIVLAHGIQASDLCVGVGSCGEEGCFLTWQGFWDAVYSTGPNELAVYVIACRGYDGVEALASRIQPYSNRNPHFVSLNAEVDGLAIRVALRVLQRLTGTIRVSPPLVPWNVLLPEVLQEFPESEAAYPAQSDNLGAVLTCARRFPELTGQSFAQYLTRPRPFRITDPHPWRRT